ncbi:uncharacterized protein LOC135428019 [Drosophila montana]|uniref:uncharacterized protein LOC135428019 n=1 Tax=Drosophila montana TaxID=40370 RepID=UPI00313EAD59
MATKALFPTLYDAETKTWSGIKRRPYYDPDCSVGEVFYTALRNWPNQVVQINDSDGSKVTNAEISQWGTRLALYLRREKLTQEDVVGIIGSSSTYVGPLVVACFFNATPFHAVNVTRDAPTVATLFVVTKPKIMFCDGSDYERIKEVTKDWAPKIVTLTGRVEGVPSIEDLLHPVAGEQLFQPASLNKNGDQTALILCSSGTSGLPKAVALSHKHVTKIAPFCKSTDLLLTHANVDWATGFIAIAIGLLYGVPRILFDGGFNAERFIGMIQKYKATTLVLAPWQAYEVFTNPLATEEALDSIRFSFITGGWISMQVLQRAQSLMKKSIVAFSYGTTETGAITVNIDHSLGSSVGRVFPGMRIRIIDEHGNKLAHNEVGEVLIDIGSKWLGYVANPIDTEATLLNGWINLGDLGYFDSNNNLYLVDRKKDLLKYKSKHYWPNELEQIIAELPDVLHVCVVGVRDTRYGDAAGALVIKKSGSSLTEQQVIDHVAQRVVVDYKQLHSGVQFVDLIPRNQNGKIMRSLAREEFEARMK